MPDLLPLPVPVWLPLGVPLVLGVPDADAVMLAVCVLVSLADAVWDGEPVGVLVGFDAVGVGETTVEGEAEGVGRGVMAPAEDATVLTTPR